MNKQVKVEIGGHEYTLEMRGTHLYCACKGRWPLCMVKFVGDSWLEEQLRKAWENEEG